MSVNGIVAKPLENPACPACGAPLPPGAEPLAELACPACGKTVLVPGRLGQQYRLTRLIGAGGMGAVFEALDEGLQRKVAVKVILKEKAAEDPAFIENFKKEAQAAGQLKSPNTVAVYAFGEEAGQPYLVMELVEADSLDRMMKAGPVMPAAVLNVGIQIAKGLKAAADVGMVHGDVKPENILLDEGRQAKLADFGIAALMGAHAAANNEVWGTPYYIAPETLKKQKVDFRADMYSLGGTLYHALAGVPPFEGADAVAVMQGRLLGPARPLRELAPSCPEGLAKIVMRMLEAEPARRYPNYDALIADLEKELKAVKAQIGGGKRIVLKGAVPRPAVGPSRPMPSVANPNAPLIPPKKGLGKGAIAAIVGGAVALPLLVIGVVLAIVLGGGEEPAPAAPAPAAPALSPEQAQAAADLAALETLGGEVAARATDLSAFPGAAEKIVKALANQARRATLPEHESWLQPAEGEAPTAMLKALQGAYAKQAALAAAAQAAEAARKTLDGLRTQAAEADPAGVAKALAEAQAAAKALADDPAAKAAEGNLRALQDLQKGWRAAVDRARAEMEAAVAARFKAEQEAKAEAARQAELERQRQAVADEVASVAEMEAAVSGSLEAFRPDQAAKAFAARAARLKSDEAQAAAALVAERIDALVRVREWVAAGAKDGSFARFGLAAPTEEGLSVNGKPLSWEDFAVHQSGAAVTLFRGALADDQGARALPTAARAELAIGARLYVNRYIGAAMLDKSKVLRDLMDTLAELADRLPNTRAKRARLEGLAPEA